MKKGIFTIEKNAAAALDTFELRLSGDASAFTRPGQFAELEVPGRFLRRPFSAASFDAGGFTVLYSLAGGGTLALSRMAPGEKIDALTGLGNGFDASVSGSRPLLIGGGAGLSPLYALSRELSARGVEFTALLGFNTAAEVCFADRFAALGARVVIATADGSAGVCGLVTDVMAGLDFTYIYACGSQAMLRAIDALADVPGQFSMDARMGCGFGACMGCSVMTASGPRRVCRDGPVFLRSELIWED